jgi:hypothetical protein
MPHNILASYILHKGIGPEIVNLLQGRVSQLVLTRHFLAPSHDVKKQGLRCGSRAAKTNTKRLRKLKAFGY